MDKLTTPRVQDFQIADGFWARTVDLVRNVVLPYQWAMLNDQVPGAEPSHCVENFRIAAGEARGDYYGMVFQDSDLAKWLEAAAYALAARRDPDLEALCDEAIRLIGKAQQPDGYLNTYFTVKEPGARWTNLRDCHELYCAGHMMEAAVACFEATGKRTLLDVMIRMARHIDSVLGPEEGKKHGYPGHEEVELALVRMYEATHDPLMLKLAGYFLDERGKKPGFFEREQAALGEKQCFRPRELDEKYAQTHLPVRAQTALEGHSVRALYMAAGMADVARETGDASLAAACRRLFENLISHRMYLTGGAGSTRVGEAFTLDDDLPGDTAYAETCASVALCFFARAMLRLEIDGRYADAMERALYNTVLAGMALDGRSFFYVNPLEVWPEACEKDPDKLHVLPVRPAWFGCACCPPNLARLILSLGRYAWSASEGEAYSHLYMAGTVDLPMGAARRRFTLETDYPWAGDMRYAMPAGRYAINVRIPGWADGRYRLTLNGAPIDALLQNGYARVAREWSEGDQLTLSIELAPRRVYASPRARAVAGRVALMRGPLVYCLEEADNGKLLPALSLGASSPLDEKRMPEKLGGIVEIRTEGSRLIEDGGALYRDRPPLRESAALTFIPYYAWANRGAGEMGVWIRES